MEQENIGETQMTFDNLIANPPYSKLGCDITKYILENVSYRDISMLGTRAMFRKHNDVLKIEYVFIKNWVLNPLSKVKWVKQVILLGHKGHCEVVPARLSCHYCPERTNEIRLPFIQGYTGDLHISLNTLLTRNRNTSYILYLSDGDYEYLKTHWDNMVSTERFWWLHDKGFYTRYKQK